MSRNCNKVHQIFNSRGTFNFNAKDFESYINKFDYFPKNGIYLMFEEGEQGHDKKRVVRVGINVKSSLATRLKNHINVKILL